MPSVRAEQPSMADYGVGSDDWEPLPWSWAAERLTRSRNFWLVTVSAGGRPHAMPVWGVWDDAAHRFSFSCSPHARKARNLAANPQVVIGSEDTVECISVEGRAALVPAGAGLESWIEQYVEKYAPIAPGYDADFLRQTAVYEVVPERAFGVIEREDEFAKRATRWRFEP